MGIWRHIFPWKRGVLIRRWLPHRFFYRLLQSKGRAFRPLPQLRWECLSAKPFPFTYRICIFPCTARTQLADLAPWESSRSNCARGCNIRCYKLYKPTEFRDFAYRDANDAWHNVSSAMIDGQLYWVLMRNGLPLFRGALRMNLSGFQVSSFIRSPTSLY